MQHNTHGRPLMLLCVAAPEDTKLLGHWERHLRPLEQAGLISFWSEQHLVAGADRLQAFQYQFDAADLVLLLLSADFFNSPDCLAMMDSALQRSQTGTVQVIPLLIRPVGWQESSLAELVSWPPNGEPITQWVDQDAAWDACIQSLRRLLGRRVSEALSSEYPHKHADPDWDRMLRLLRRSYKDLLDQSLHGITWVDLGLSRRPDLVSNVTNLLFRRAHGNERLLAPGTSMLDVYDEAEGELLILGAPGAGKSTLLLDLAQRLVDRASTSEVPLLPVILRLSSWALGRPALAEWMIEQFAQTYGVPRALAERWVIEGSVLPLLDGLDEMEEAARPLCIAAINAYHRTHLAPLVVCSRHTEYEVAARRERLALQSAVIVQPLRDEQIEAYLSLTGPSFAGVRVALQQPVLRDLATTPLMLSVLLLTYREVPAERIIQQGTELEQQVWTDYVARQIREKGNDARYPLERTRAWLSWLAQQMQTHQQTTFYAEYLQPDSLTFGQQRTVTWLALRLPAIVIGVCAGLLVFLFVAITTFTTGASQFLLQIGLLGGFVGGRLSQQVVAEANPDTCRRSHEQWRDLRLAVLIGMLLAASFGLNLHTPQHAPQHIYSDPGYFLGDWVRDGCIVGLGGGLSFWIFQRLLHPLPGTRGREDRVRPGRRWSLATRLTEMAAPSVWQAATALGAGVGLSAWLIYGLRVGLSIGLSDGLRVGLIVGLNISIMIVLVHVILAHSMGTLRFAERIHWTWHALFQSEHLHSSLLLAGALFLSIGLSYRLTFGPTFGLREGLIYGLSAGLSVGLSYWIVLGLYQGMKQDHLHDQDRQQFNQGIRRSLRNGLLLGLISAIIINTIGVLSNGLSYGLIFGLSYGLSDGMNYGLSYGLSSGLSEAWVCLLAGTVVMWALFGGITILRHYVIRWLLAHHRMFPWRAQTFLDDATNRILLRRIGGGYSFIHRRLQDYFTDSVPPPSQK